MSNKTITDKLDIGISVIKCCPKKFKDRDIESALHDHKGRGRKVEISKDNIHPGNQ